ncbi:MAG: carbohydrate ABC transporter permease [archaeon]
MITDKLNLSLEQKRNYSGYLWISPFLIGFYLFFLKPIVKSMIFSFTELNIMHGGYNLDYVGFDNYNYAFSSHPDYLRTLMETTTEIILEIPAILIISFFIAYLLNKEFKGRLIVRIIFFLPVILNAGVVAEIESADYMHQLISAEAGTQAQIFGASFVIEHLQSLELPSFMINYVVNTSMNIPDIINASAIPILIFLAGLQSIPNSLYNCAKIEGANSWETFWKITFPLVSPLFVTNMVFIIIRSFTASDNNLVNLISDLAWGQNNFGVSVAMTWIYFIVIGLILITAGGIMARNAVYME